MNNTLGDLNNYLFAELEALDNKDLEGEDLEMQIKKADSVAKIADQIIKNGELQLKAMIHMDEFGYAREKRVPSMLEVH